MDRESSWPLDWAKSRKDSAVSSTASLMGKGSGFRGGVLLVRAGQGDQGGDQTGELFRLAQGLVDPLLFPHLHLQDFQTGGDDGDGGL